MFTEILWLCGEFVGAAVTGISVLLEGLQLSGKDSPSNKYLSFNFKMSRKKSRYSKPASAYV